MSIKIAVIGAGSIGFTRQLLQDVLTVPELEDTEFSFIDINEQNLGMMVQLAERDIKANNKQAHSFLHQNPDNQSSRIN